MLVVVSGLPGTGKSAVAEMLARRLGAVHVSVDPIEEALLRSGLQESWEVGVAAYEAAAADDVRFVLLELGDAQEHRRRLETRPTSFAHVRSLTWDDVLARAATYEPWPDGTCLRLDATAPVDDVVEEVLARLP